MAGTTLTVLLANTSVVPVGGQNGSASMVLSSLSFDLPAGIDVLGGSAVLGPGATVVQSTTGSAWSSFGGPVELNLQYGFSNTGVRNSGGVILGATTAMTSHSNGGNQVIAFGGGGIANNGLEWGLVPFNSLDHGDRKVFVQNSVLFTLQLSAPLTDTSFLANGTYVEFGSDHLYVPGTELTPVTESASLAIVGSGALLVAARMRKRRRQ